MDVREALATCGADNQGLATLGDLVRCGVPRVAVSRGYADARIRRPRRRVYSLTPLQPVPRFVVTEVGVAPAFALHARAALMSLGPLATASLRTAAALRGWGLLVEPRTLDVAVEHGRTRVDADGVKVVQRRRLDREQRVVVPGTQPLWVTTAAQTVVDCCLELPLLQAVVVCDSALRSGQVTLAELERAAADVVGVREPRRVRRVLGLADPLSGSVLESVLRVRMVEGELCGFTTQQVLRDAAGGRVLRVDFCFEAVRLVVEVDGARWHPDPARDRSLDNALARLGWRVLRFTWAEVVHRPEEVLAAVRTAVAFGTQNIHPSVWRTQAAA